MFFLLQTLIKRNAMATDNLIIKDLQPSSVKPLQPLQRNEESKSGDAFKNLLSSKLDETKNQALKPETHQSLTELDAPSPISSIDVTGEKMSSSIASALDLFDRYNSLLSDPDKNLREIVPVLNQLNDASQRIKDTMNSEGNPEKGLSGIIDQLLFLVRLEEVKIQQGDYTDKIA